MIDAARLHVNGFDAMRYLGADPTRRADLVERIVVAELNRFVVREESGG